MINANELRIGSLVLKAEITEEISSIHSDNTIRLKQGESSKGCYHIKLIQPIPLTEEWLDKFCFEKNYEEFNDDETPSVVEHWILINGYRIDCDYYYSQGVGRYVFGKSFPKAGTEMVISEPKYVHQLQNLYFALTGEELTIN